LEFESAFRAEMADYFLLGSPDVNVGFDYADALSSPSGASISLDDEAAFEMTPASQIASYESGMQYVTVSYLPSRFFADVDDAMTTPTTPPLDAIFASAIGRCSLVRVAFRVVAEGRTHGNLAEMALRNGSFEDLMTTGDALPTWSIRLRRYGIRGDDANASVDDSDDASDGNDNEQHRQEEQRHRRRVTRRARFGKNARSPLRSERDAIMSMAELVRAFRGRVDLADPTCGIYILEGLRSPRRDVTSNEYDYADAGKDFVIGGVGVGGEAVGEENMLLARVVARGPKTSIYAPKTRICVTRTPLCPIASFALCNVARLRQGATVLDPFAGSCATLLAASHITSRSPPSPDTGLGGGCCRSVAIEIAHNGNVDRDDIVLDFEARSLPPPLEIIHGDCLSSDVRTRARNAIGGGAFDVIVTDPPYGIREAMTSSAPSSPGRGDQEEIVSPLTELFRAMGRDRTGAGTPLLKVGGRLVAFVPVRSHERLEDCLPDTKDRDGAGLVMEGGGREQVLSDSLSRYLVSFICVS
jgi:hypothetical protein